MEGLISFDSKPVLEQELAKHIAEILHDCVISNGTATLLLSGGSTPKQLYQQLGQFDIEWAQIHIGLVDERFVDHAHDASNEKLIRESLMNGKASIATFHSMVIDASNYEENLKLAIQENEIFRNADVIILGMGDDGHTASLFPNEERSLAAISSAELMANTYSPNEPSRRITFCGPILQQGKHLLLMITGAKKLKVLTESKENNHPIHYFIPFIEGIYYTENV